MFTLSLNFKLADWKRDEFGAGRQTTRALLLRQMRLVLTQIDTRTLPLHAWKAKTTFICFRHEGHCYDTHL